MTTQASSSHYQRGLQLAEAGRYQEGLNCIRQHLRAVPHDADALNDAGAILHCLGHSDEAIACLTKARDLRADSGEIVWNLVEAYLGHARAGDAAALFDDMEQMGILNIDVLNRTATMLLDQGEKGRAIEVLLRSYRLWPEQQVLQPMIDVIRSKRPKVAYFRRPDARDGVLADICEFTAQRFETEFHAGGAPADIAERMDWSDISWFDGGGETVVQASQQRHRCRTIVSVRRCDLRDRWAGQVRWENVDILVQIGSSAVEEAMLQYVPDIRNRTRLVVVPNGIDLDRYAFQPRQRGKCLACLDCLTMTANPAFLLQCMQKLRYLDPQYRLFFSGAFESPVLEQYVRHMVQVLGLADAVTFEPWASDLSGWLSDKHFILAAGIDESQVEAVLAGMACGLKPVIHHFPGAEKLFPAQHLFSIAEQFCDRVLAPDYEPEHYRRFVEDRYSGREQLRMVNSILTQLETEIDLQKLAMCGCEGGVTRQ